MGESRRAAVSTQLDCLAKTRKWKKIEFTRLIISNFQGDSSDAITSASLEIAALSQDIIEFNELTRIILDTTKLGSDLSFLAIWQLLVIQKKKGKELKEYLEYVRYSLIKNSLSKSLNELNTSWKSPVLSETKGKLVVNMPDPSHISNGQRDILLLLSLFHVARIKLVKKRAIIVIDEVFDYLDDANLTVAQYYTSLLINEYKRQGRSIYPIILTHLNPAFFRNYVFSNQNTIYLEKGAAFGSINAMKKLISARSEDRYCEDLKTKIAKYLVHYHIDEYDFSSELLEVGGCRSSWGKRGKFQQFLSDEFNKYQSGEKYDPLAICAIARRSIEELAYKQILASVSSLEFFSTNTTASKLDFAKQLGANIPESHYLLRVIYDDGLHWRENRDNTIPIVAKLGNAVIKKMIVDTVTQCQTC